MPSLSLSLSPGPRLSRYLGVRSLARDELEGDFVREREKVKKKRERESGVEWGRKIGFSVNAAAEADNDGQRRSQVLPRDEEVH